MGQVYLAENPKLHRKVSFKFLSTNLAHDRERMRRFEQEARPISALNHPDTFTIHEISEVDGQTLSLLSSSADKHFGTIEVGH